MSGSQSISAFVGTWELLESYSEKDGQRVPLPLGGNVIGRINYDTAGNMAAQLMGAGRAGFTARNPSEVPDDEYRAAFQSYTSYFGTYEIDQAAGTITHHVLGALTPSWPGHAQVRYYELDDRQLTLRTPPMRDNSGEKVVHTLVWRKIV